MKTTVDAKQATPTAAVANRYEILASLDHFLGSVLGGPPAVAVGGFKVLVSKRRDRPYQAGRSKHWIKIKNRQHLAMDRVKEFAG